MTQYDRFAYAQRNMESLTDSFKKAAIACLEAGKAIQPFATLAKRQAHEVRTLIKKQRARRHK